MVRLPIPPEMVDEESAPFLTVIALLLMVWSLLESVAVQVIPAFVQVTVLYEFTAPLTPSKSSAPQLVVVPPSPPPVFSVVVPVTVLLFSDTLPEASFALM